MGGDYFSRLLVRSSKLFLYEPVADLCPSIDGWSLKTIHCSQRPGPDISITRRFDGLDLLAIQVNDFCHAGPLSYLLPNESVFSLFDNYAPSIGANYVAVWWGYARGR